MLNGAPQLHHFGSRRSSRLRRRERGRSGSSVLSALNEYAVRKNLTIPELATRMREIEEDPASFPYVIARHLNMEVAEQQAMLECVNPVERLEKILGNLKAAKRMRLDTREGTPRALI